MGGVRNTDWTNTTLGKEFSDLRKDPRGRIPAYRWQRDGFMMVVFKRADGDWKWVAWPYLEVGRGRRDVETGVANSKIEAMHAAKHYVHVGHAGRVTRPSGSANAKAARPGDYLFSE